MTWFYPHYTSFMTGNSDHLWVIRTSNSGKNIPLSPWPHRDPCESAQQSPWPKSTRPRPANQRGSVGENDIRQAMQLLYHMATYIYIYIYTVHIYIYIYVVYIYIVYIYIL